MIKILHSADWHLGAPMAGSASLRQALLEVPEKVVQACRATQCDLLLLSGDLFDGKPDAESLLRCRQALAEVTVPVFISPGNHDPLMPDSPYLTEDWPENVHIFTDDALQSVALPALNCRIYGAAFRCMDCPSLLEGFRAQGEEPFHIAVLHGDPTNPGSAYNPITRAQVEASGLRYLALGHIHKTGSLRAGDTLCAWPGCPMGRGYDEVGEKGVLLVTLTDTQTQAEFLPLDTPRFQDITVEIRTDARSALAEALPAAGSRDYYRVTLTGEAEKPALDALTAEFSQFPNLLLRDRTVPPAALWDCIDQDSLEGVYFRLLHDALADADPETAQTITLAATLSRRLLEGREVTLP